MKDFNRERAAFLNSQKIKLSYFYLKQLMVYNCFIYYCLYITVLYNTGFC